MESSDVIIIGAGPAGILAAREIIINHPETTITIVEKGSSLKRRRCPTQRGRGPCRAEACPTCSLLSGWGGAGAFSDGKLTLTTDIGGNLTEYVGVQQAEELIRYADRIFLEMGATERLWGTDRQALEKLQVQAGVHGFSFIPGQIRHLGTELCRRVLGNFFDFLSPQCKIIFNSPVKRILRRGGKVQGVKLNDGRVLKAPYVILATGREGAPWLQREIDRLKLPKKRNPVDIGVRVEVPSEVMAPLTDITYEPKLIFHNPTFNDHIRTFCVCPRGEVINEFNQGIYTVNGHSYADDPTANTNFAILVSTFFTEPFDDPVTYGRSVARLANLLSKGILIQRLSDLRAGRRSTHDRILKGLVKPTLKEAVPGDLSFVLPYRILTDILEMLEAMEALAPGIWSGSTLLYGVEVKFYSLRLILTSSLETKIKNLFAVGDGAGVSRGLVQAAASGVVAAREIIRRLEQDKPK